MAPTKREAYRSPNGDCWLLGRDPINGHAFVVHEPDVPSGGKRTQIEIGTFLRSGSAGPEHQALLRLIGTLAEEAANDPKA